MNRTLASTVGILATLCSVQATAQDVRTIKVAYADLDLTNPAGIAALQHRVKYAITGVCGIPDAKDLSAVTASRTCRKKAVASSQTQVAYAVDKATQLAQRRGGAEVAIR